MQNGVYVGAGKGTPGMLMAEAGLENAFGHIDENWHCVPDTDIIAANPDVIVVVHASWDTALDKIQWLYNHAELCDLDVMKGARFVQIPFSASTLSPRSGVATLDLAIASLQVRTGSLTTTGASGVSSFTPQFLATNTEGLACALKEADVPKYRTLDDVEDANAAVHQESTLASGLLFGIIVVGILSMS